MEHAERGSKQDGHGDLWSKAPSVRDDHILRSLNDAAKKQVGKMPGIQRLAAQNYSIPDLSDKDAGPVTDWHQLIILGNGFDLQCGLRSQFSHFFEPRFEAIAGIRDCRRETWAELLADTDLTLWDFVLENNLDSLWCDVEGTVERWILSAGFPASSEDSLFGRALEALGHCPFDAEGEPSVNRSIACYLWTLLPEAAAGGFSRELFMGILRQELIKLENAFGRYLANEVAANEQYAENCRMLYNAIERDGKKTDEGFRTSTSVLSFNYTDEVGKIFDGGEDGCFVNIHGRLGGEIIFGIDGKDCMDNHEAVSFTKTFRLMQRGGSRTDKLVRTANSANLHGATDVIKFYGHSLGRADYSYFQSIFDGVDLYESKTVLAFYYPYDADDASDASNVGWRTYLANLINDLLVAYGATMDNKDHGKNLMHKLLLEGRLIIRGV